MFNALSDLISPGQPLTHGLALRHACASWLTKALSDDGDYNIWGPIILHMQQFTGEQSLGQYLDNLVLSHSNGGHWGDNMILGMAARALGFNAIVYALEQSSTRLVIQSEHTYWPPSSPQAMLYFSGDTSGGHYEPLRLQSHPNSAPLGGILDKLRDATTEPITALNCFSTESKQKLRRQCWNFIRPMIANSYSMAEAWHGTRTLLSFITGTTSVPQNRSSSKKAKIV
jgi:hypothetical protein